LHGYTERQQAGILDFQTVVEETPGESARRAGKIGMDSRVDIASRTAAAGRPPRVSVDARR